LFECIGYPKVRVIKQIRKQKKEKEEKRKKYKTDPGEPVGPAREKARGPFQPYPNQYP
jgi:hypothetical protein